MDKMKVENVGEEYVFTSVSKEGEKEREYKHISEFGVIKQLVADMKYLLNDKLSNEKLIKDTMKEMGVIVPTNANPTYVLCKTLLTKRVLENDIDYVALESVDGYIKKASRVDSIFAKDYVDKYEQILNGCYQVIDGEIVLDEDKLNAMVGTL